MSGDGQPGFLFNTGSVGRCDDYKVGGAMMRWNPVLDKFCIWYYGRSTDFPAGMAPALGSGSVALTTSEDGLNWERFVLRGLSWNLRFELGVFCFDKAELNPKV